MKTFKFLVILIASALMTVMAFNQGVKSQIGINEDIIDEIAKKSHADAITQIQLFCEIRKPFTIGDNTYHCINEDDIKRKSSTPPPYYRAPKEQSI